MPEHGMAQSEIPIKIMRYTTQQAYSWEFRIIGLR